MSPFAARAYENNFICFTGKPDDITIIVAQVRAIDQLNTKK